MVETAQEKWNVSFVEDKKGLGFHRETPAPAAGDTKGEPGVERSVISLPPFDAAKVGKRGSSWRSEDEFVTRLAVEVGHACAYEQAARDPAARPDPLDAQKAGEKSRQTAAFAREDMVSNMASMEFVTAAGFKFTPAPHEETSHMREAQAQALNEPGGYSKVTYNAARTMRMLEGQQPTARDDARARRQEQFQDRALGLSEIDRAARGIPDLAATPLTADAGRDVGSHNRPAPQSGPAAQPDKGRSRTP